MSKFSALKNPDTYFDFVKKIFIFSTLFIFGPMFGGIIAFLLIFLHRLEMLNLIEAAKILFLMIFTEHFIPFCMIFGGIQGYVGGLFAVRQFKKHGFVPFDDLLKSAFQVSLIPSLIYCTFILIRSEQNIFLHFIYAIIVHLDAALCAWVIISPLRCTPASSAPES